MFRCDPRRQSGKRRSDLGFSLIEVAVIIMVVAIVTAFVVPQALAWMRLYRLGVGARNVATALQRARFLATSNNTRVAVTIKGSQVVKIEQYDQLASAEAQVKAVIELPTGISIDDSAPREVAFDGRGVVTPLPAESPTIRVNSTDGYYQVVVVSPTGQVTISGAKSGAKT